MKNSILLRRIVLLLLSALMLSGVLSAGLYLLVTRQMVVQMRADELLPTARSIAEMMAGTGTGDPWSWWNPGPDNKGFLGAMLHIYDADGNPVMNPPRDGERRPQGDGSNLPPSDERVITGIALYDILSGSEISVVQKSGDGLSYLIVGVPIQKDGVISGAVVFTKSVSELNDAMRGMNVTLIFSTLIAFVIMLIPGFLLARRLVVPIRKMESAALAMSKGDFTVRADESQKGEIGELARAMNRFAVESGRLEQTRRDYVANVSHELRTPVSAIRAMGETLRDGLAKSAEKQALFYNNIVRESMRLSRLVEDLLELSRLQSDAAPLQKTVIDLRDVIRNAADIYCHVAAEAGVQFAFYLDMDKPAPIYSNADRLEQVLVILLDNAIKHTPNEGSVTLSVSDRQEFLEIAVSDTGEGIPPEDRPHIFERFYTVDKSHSGGGTGLGLSIAAEIMKGLGESIRVESGADGTVFTVTATRPRDRHLS